MYGRIPIPGRSEVWCSSWQEQKEVEMQGASYVASADFSGACLPAAMIVSFCPSASPCALVSWCSQTSSKGRVFNKSESLAQ